MKFTEPQLNTLIQVATAHSDGRTLHLADSYKPKDALLRAGLIREGKWTDRYSLTDYGKEYLEKLGWVPPPRHEPRLKNQGLQPYRFKDNPEERRFAEAWDAINQPLRTPGVTGPTLAYLLCPDPEQKHVEEPRESDRVVAATVIQWLGSPVGQAWLRDLGYTKKE